MPAFLTARVQRHCCPLFGRARRRQGRNLYLWNRLREPGRTFAFPDWRTPCRAIAGQPGREECVGLIRAGRWPPRPRPNHPDPALRRNLFRPDSRPAIGHAHPERPAGAMPPNRSSAGQRIDWRELLRYARQAVTSFLVEHARWQRVKENGQSARDDCLHSRVDQKIRRSCETGLSLSPGSRQEIE